MKNNKIIAVHLLNDFSGSPLVLSNCIDALIEGGCEVDLYTGGGGGFLSKVKCNHIKYNYKRFDNKFMTLFSLMISQTILFFTIYLKVARCPKYKRPTLIINTVLPFGAALAGWVGGCKVIYYVHETSIRPIIFKKVLKFILRMTATEIIYVSKYLKSVEGLKIKHRDIKEHVVYNSLPSSHVDYLVGEHKVDFSIFMPCSLKEYKGVYEFVAIARSLQNLDVKFVLALNCEEKEFSDFKKEVGLVSNLELFRRPDNIQEIYGYSSLVVNLSKPDAWIETFGMTVIEAFSKGCPVIVPPVGGIAELVEDGFNGYKISVENSKWICEKIMQLYQDEALLTILSLNALESSRQYLYPEYKRRILDII